MALRLRAWRWLMRATSGGFPAAFADEQHGEHHRGDVVVPGQPALHLIVGETTLAFGVLEGALDPVALSLHARELRGVGVGRGVGQAVFDRFRRADLAADDEMPAASLGFRAVPQPDPPVRDVDLQGTTGVSRRRQRVQFSARNLLTSFSTERGSAAARCLVGWRPRALFGAGTCRPGGSVQIIWLECTSATNTSPASSSARRKAGSLP